jgi:hypothetical protein
MENRVKTGVELLSSEKYNGEEGKYRQNLKIQYTLTRHNGDGGTI